MIIIEHWPKSDLPVCWNGQKPVHVLPEVEEVDETKYSLKYLRKLLLDKQIELIKKQHHFHLIREGKIIYNSAFINHY